MCLRITNICFSAFDVLRFDFESAGVLEMSNEYLGYGYS